MLPVSAARSSSDGSAIRYVLRVLWMTSSVSQNGTDWPKSSTTLLRRVRQVEAPWRSLLSTTATCFRRLSSYNDVGCYTATTIFIAKQSQEYLMLIGNGFSRYAAFLV